MSYTEVDICNLALGRLGVDKTILVLATEQSKEARNCRRFYPLARDEVLEKVPWPFAVKTQALSLLADGDLLPGWSYQYGQPTDMLTMLELVPEAQITEAAGYWSNCEGPWAAPRPSRNPFRKALSQDGERPVILANIRDAYAIYVARVTNTLAYSTLMASLIADRLAMELAMPLTVDPRYFSLAQQRYAAAFVDTSSRHFEQEQHTPAGEPPSIQARN